MSRKKKLFWLFWIVWLLNIRQFEEDEQISKNFTHEYNRSLDKADSEIENGNFVHQNDVEAFFDKRRQSI